MGSMPTKKNDGAPMIPFIDIIKSSNFPQPILPMPCRIDKVVNGSSSLTILPKKPISIEFNNKIITFDFHNLYLHFYQNIIYYAKKKYREMMHRDLPIALIKTWWTQSKPLKAQIQDYALDIDFVFSAYLRSYISYLQSNRNDESLLLYCDEVIEYCQRKIEENVIKFVLKKKEITKRMYRTKEKKKEKYHFPDIWEFDVVNQDTGKSFRKAFIPVMIYDDLLESFLYNKMRIEKKLGVNEEEYGEIEEDEDLSELKLVSFKELEEQNILISLSQEEFNNKNFELKDIIENIEFNEIFLYLCEEEEEDFFNV